MHTDGGLRVAALVPATTSAVLVEPDTSVTESVTLPSTLLAAVDRDQRGRERDGTDVALLWNAPARRRRLLDAGGDGRAAVPQRRGAGHPGRRARGPRRPRAAPRAQAPPDDVGLDLLHARPRDAHGGAARDAGRPVARRVARRRARLGVRTPHLAARGAGRDRRCTPCPSTSTGPSTRSSTSPATTGGASLVALHGTGDVGATVFDALSPDTATARSYSALLLEGL